MTHFIRRIVIGLIVAVLAVGPMISVLAQSELRVTIDRLDDSKFPELTLDVSAIDSNGVPVANLDVTAFQGQEDIKPLTINAVQPFQDDQAPLVMVLAIDLSGSMTGKPLDDAKAAAKALIDLLRPVDQLAVIGFSDKVDLKEPLTFTATKEIDFTADKAALRGLIDRLKASGGTPLYDAAFKAMRLLTKQTASRHAVILMTDGNDKDPGSNVTIDDLITKATAAHIPIFTVGFGTNADVKSLERIALTTTGGSSFTAKTAAELQARFKEVFTRMKTSYRLTARSQIVPDGGSHTLAVSVKTSGNSAEAMTEYKAQPGAVQILKIEYDVQGQKIQMKDGVELKGVVPVETTVSSKSRLARVEYIVDDKTNEPLLKEPWVYQWNTCQLTPGPHTLRVRATDDQGLADERTFSATVQSGDFIACLMAGENSTTILIVAGAALLLIILVVVVVVSRRRTAEPTYAEPIPEPPPFVPFPAPMQPPAPAPMAPLPNAGPVGPASGSATRHMSGSGGFSGPTSVSEISVPRGLIKTEMLEVGPKVLAWFVIEQGPHTGKEFRLSDATTIGRDSTHCDITLDDGGVSGQHAKVRLDGDKFYIQDLASTNGTFIRTADGGWEKILKQPLTDGTRIKLGATVFVFKQA